LTKEGSIIRKNRSKPFVSKKDINFLRELGDSKIGKIAQYELSQMYEISVDEIDRLINRSREQQN
jgi:galactokinase